MASDKTKNARRRTIAKELFDQWRKCMRKNDAQAIADELNVSKPTIDKALIYGAVHQQAIIDGITNYFAARLLREKESAGNLANLATKTPV